MTLNDKVNTAREVLADTKSRMIIVILVIIVIAVLGIAYFKFKRSSVAPAGMGSSLAGAPNIVSIPGMGQPTREYAKLQEQQNLDLATEAARKGTSAMPTVVRTTYLDAGVSSDLKKGSGATSTSGCSVEDLKRARDSGVDVTELRCRGCSLAALKDAGFSAGELRNAGFGAQELKDVGFSASDLKSAGFSAKELASSGVDAKTLSNAGFSVGELKKAGFSNSEIQAAGYSAAAIKSIEANPDGCDIKKLQEARSKGGQASKLKELGCSVSALRAAGYTASELRTAGFGAGELRAAGFDPNELKDAGFSASELKNAGLSSSDLVKAGFSPDELLNAGYTRGDLVRAGVRDSVVASVEINSCSVESLKKAYKAGKKVADLRKLGCSAAALREAGFTIDELKAAGLSDDELRAAGFPPEELKKAGLVDVPKKADSAQVEVQDTIGRIAPERMADMSDQDLENLVKQQQAMMMMQANQLFSAWTPIPSQQYVEGETPKVDKGEAAKLTPQEQQAIALKNSDIYKAGTVILATLDTEVNSDENTPVRATIVHGPMKGSKVIGNFQRVDQKILLQFTVLSIPKLTNSIPINVVAVDPDTDRTALVSSVDNHYMLRYGTMLASGFMSGLGEAFQTSGSQLSTNITGTTSTMPALTLGEKTIVAFGNMAQQFSTAMAPKINTPPTVKVNAGTSIGLLLMADLAVPRN
ncbi:MAG: hypothetical protein KKE11_00445 [Gammaproteobacteria bacterium]|nr:hypothetical protein [Gammaproteobacteria bacterium]